ncbi:MAG: helix-turn-helix transcriptional regulator [Alphaproteobacteria bacterium]
MAEDAIDRAVRETEAALITGLSRTTRWRLEKAGQFPQKIELAPGLFGYRLSDLKHWLESRPSKSLAERQPRHGAAHEAA